MVERSLVTSLMAISDAKRRRTVTVQVFATDTVA